MQDKLPSILRIAALALVAGTVLSGTYQASQDKILENERRQLEQSLRTTLRRIPDAGNLELTEFRLPAELAAAHAPAFALHSGSRIEAIIFSTLAPQGYAGPIRLLVAIDREGRLAGVEVTSHRETPGLGDAIERTRTAWLDQFDGTSLREPRGWAVQPDGGEFDAITGATITARAVVDAMHHLLLDLEAHHNQLFNQPITGNAHGDPAP